MRTYSRASELGLLLWPCLIAALGFAQLHVIRGGSWTQTETITASAVPLVALVSHVWLSIRQPRADRVLLPIALSLAAIGLVVVARLQPELATRQAIWLGLGVAGVVLGGWLANQRSWMLRYRYTIGAL